MLENIIFGILVVLAAGAGILTCVYEVNGFSHTKTDGKSRVKQTKQPITNDRLK